MEMFNKWSSGILLLLGMSLSFMSAFLEGELMLRTLLTAITILLAALWFRVGQVSP